MTKLRDGFFRNMFNYLTKVRPAKLKSVEEVVGTDLDGNRYLVRRGDPSLKRKDVRFVLAPENKVQDYLENAKVDTVPPEWEAWLRFTRNDPPTLEELEKNMIEKLKVQERVKEIKLKEDMEKAGKLEGEPGHTVVARDVSVTSDKVPYPVYDDLERVPGEFRRKKPPKK
ncbi:hypothetical protein ACF0H5_003973 [Mactra antiquata]